MIKEMTKGLTFRLHLRKFNIIYHAPQAAENLEKDTCKQSLAPCELLILLQIIQIIHITFGI